MNRFLLITPFILFFTSCSHQSSETWENMKTAGRYMQRGVDSLLGKEYESRMLSSDDDFYGPFDDDFIPLEDRDLKHQLADRALPQPTQNPNQGGFPGLNEFHVPPESLQALFQIVHFDTDQSVIRNRNEVSSLLKLAQYLKTHPNLYIVVEGHCDERASADYNKALGMRRAHSVRSFLVKHGANLNQIYTVSMGKEQPVALGHTPDDWKINRRSEFRIYER